MLSHESKSLKKLKSLESKKSDGKPRLTYHRRRVSCDCSAVLSRALPCHSRLVPGAGVPVSTFICIFAAPFLYLDVLTPHIPPCYSCPQYSAQYRAVRACGPGAGGRAVSPGSV